MLGSTLLSNITRSRMRLVALILVAPVCSAARVDEAGSTHIQKIIGAATQG